MIDERHEELAALHALDLLEGAERSQFEAALAQDPALQALVRELREASSAMGRVGAVPPPSALKARVMASIAASSIPGTDNIIRPPAFRFSRAIPWAIAAGFAVFAAWMGQRFASTQAELTSVRQQHQLADVALQGMRQQLEAERIVTRRQVQDLDEQRTQAQTQLAVARSQVDSITTQLANLTTQGAERERLTGTLQQQLAAARALADERNQQIATLNQRIDAVAGASAEIGKQLGDAKERIAKLSSEMKLQRDIAEFKISLLASLAKDQPEARAVAVWDPTLQQGVLKVENLPALAANQDYQLWVVDPAYKDPVDGGVFTVTTQAGETRINFSPKQPIKAANAFAITRERKGGVPKSAGPILLLGK